eukprot:PhM_4_TR15662/c3_g1_i1/m.3399/K00898/PDK2_3_4; pyruvate dehydrogenase kinase 2/3/4
MFRRPCRVTLCHILGGGSVQMRGPSAAVQQQQQQQQQQVAPTPASASAAMQSQSPTAMYKAPCPVMPSVDSMWTQTLDQRVQQLEDASEDVMQRVLALGRVLEKRDPEVADLLKTWSTMKPKTLDSSTVAGIFAELRNYYVQQPVESVSLELLTRVRESPSLLPYAGFVHRECLVRMAKHILLLDGMPHGLSHMPSIQIVKGWYLRSFAELRKVECPTTTEDLVKLYDALEKIYERHADTIETMSLGVQELASHMRLEVRSDVLPELQPVLDIFIAQRLGIRLLIGTYILLCRTKALPVKVRRDSSVELDLLEHSPQDFVGLICTKCNVRRCVELAVEAVKKDAETLFAGKQLPIIEVKFSKNEPEVFAYLPHYIYQIVCELVHNAVRHLVKVPRREIIGDDDNKNKVARVTVRVQDDPANEDVVISVKDNGMGMSRDALGKAWSYTYSTKPGQHVKKGFGLPLSRVRAEHFGGALKLTSVRGVGSTAYVYLPRKSNTSEKLY